MADKKIELATNDVYEFVERMVKENQELFDALADS
jgi:hypothetical protein